MMKEIVLVVGAHPDDEILGVGGTLSKHSSRGDEVHALILCEGMSLRYPDEKIDFLKFEGENASKVIGMKTWTQHGFPDQMLDTMPLSKIAKPIEEKIRNLKPTIIYTHIKNDINKDHKIAHEATLVASRCKEKSISFIYGYETPSETEWEIPYSFKPNFYVDISDHIDTKIEAMKCYKSQLYDSPHPRSLEHLKNRSRYWGEIMLMQMAEPFEMLRGYFR